MILVTLWQTEPGNDADSSQPANVQTVSNTTLLSFHYFVRQCGSSRYQGNRSFIAADSAEMSEKNSKRKSVPHPNT
jgi:hypothetical protein